MDIIKPAKAPLWRRRRVLVTAGSTAALLVVFVSIFGLGQAAPKVDRTNLWIDAAQRGDMVRELRATGVLVPKDIRWITANTTATVQDVVVLAGAEVQPDTVILRMVNPELQANLEKAEAAFAGAGADVAATRTSLSSQLLDQRSLQTQAESDWHIAEVKNTAMGRAHAAGVVPDIEVKESQIVLEQSRKKASIERERGVALSRNMEAQLAAAAARRDEAASAARVARQQADSLVVKAGIAGILQQVDVEPGQQVQAGAKLARIARPGELIARLQVSEALAKDLVLKLPVKVDTRNGIVDGRIQRIDPAVKNGSVTIDVGFEHQLPDGARPDLSVEGRIQLGVVRDVVSVGRPPTAVPDTASSLFVLKPGESLAQRVPVHFGSASSDRIEVRKGLRPGDQAILSDTSQWADYQALRVR